MSGGVWDKCGGVWDKCSSEEPDDKFGATHDYW